MDIPITGTTLLFLLVLFGVFKMVKEIMDYDKELQFKLEKMKGEIDG